MRATSPHAPLASLASLTSGDRAIAAWRSVTSRFLVFSNGRGGSRVRAAWQIALFARKKTAICANGDAFASVTTRVVVAPSGLLSFERPSPFADLLLASPRVSEATGRTDCSIWRYSGTRRGSQSLPRTLGNSSKARIAGPPAPRSSCRTDDRFVSRTTPSGARNRPNRWCADLAERPTNNPYELFKSGFEVLQDHVGWPR